MITGIVVVFVLQIGMRLSVAEINPVTKPQTTLAAIAASVPVGFLLYQMYYATYGPTLIIFRFLHPWDRRTRVSRDRGAEILGSLPPDRLAQLRHRFGARLDVRRWYTHRPRRPYATPVLDEAAIRAAYPTSDDGLAWSGAAVLKPRDATKAAFPHVEVDPRQATRIYADNWRENWTVFRSLLDLAASHAEAKELKTEFTTLSDIYHALGASRLAVPVGWLIGVIYAVAGYTPRVLDHLLGVIFAAALMLVVCTFVFWVLHRARRATWQSALACAHYGLTWCFATHPEFMQLDGREYPYTPRKDLRQSHDGDTAPTPRGRRRPWRRTRPPRRIP